MELLKVKKEKCIIFEDSHTGYLSACKSNPFKTYIYLNGENNEMLNLSKYTFTNYNQLSLEQLFLENNDYLHISFINELKNQLNNLPIQHIQNKKNNNLKTGYICDIDKYNITYLNESNFNIITKISNLNNELSKTAIKLNMYNNEVYFYQYLLKYINCICIPKCYTCFKFEHKDVIVLEDLYELNGIFNINLNNNIKILLNVVENIFNMHNLFYFYNYDEIPLNMKTLHTPNQIDYYKELINNRLNKFIIKNKFMLNEKYIKILNTIYKIFDFILNESLKYPLNFCHGDLKSLIFL